MNNQPLVSIGFPIYNSGSLLKRALDDLLNQSYGNFELIISDNASTDDTWKTCQEYAASDPRIRLFQNTENIGALANFAHVLTLATGKYFMWAAHDDQWEANFIEECVTQLEAHPDSSLCFVQHIHFDDRTGKRSTINYPIGLQSPMVWQRLQSLLLCWPLPNVIVYGLFRTDFLRRADPIVYGSGAPDTLVLLKTLLVGKFIQVDQPLHIYTVSHRDIKTRIKQMQFQGKSITGILLSTDFRLFMTLIRLANQTTSDLRSRLLVWRSVMIFMYHVAGWPISRRLIVRYVFPMLPHWFQNKILQLRSNL
jgi:glycosyltransferase involved in cell wall biosynthesis